MENTFLNAACSIDLWVIIVLLVLNLLALLDQDRLRV